MLCERCNGTGQRQGTDRLYQCGKCAGKGTVPMFYAGIGARKAPSDILQQMQVIAMRLALAGYALRSGGALGADHAFEKGADAVRGAKVIFPATKLPEAIAHARQYHPTFDTLAPYVQQLHARNSLIILGIDLVSPVEFIVCWTPAGMVVGGTGQALRVAQATGIKVFNLASEPVDTLWEWIDAQG